MDITFILNQIKSGIFRPISGLLLSAVENYLHEEIKNEEKRKTYDSVFQMDVVQFSVLALDAFFGSSKTLDSFYLCCICSRIGRLEAETPVPNVSIGNLRWQEYLNMSGRSSVAEYSLNDTFLAVRFGAYPKVYVYSYSKTGFLGTEFMKECAKQGYGLGHCTSTYFRDKRGFTIIR